MWPFRKNNIGLVVVRHIPFNFTLCGLCIFWLLLFFFYWNQEPCCGYHGVLLWWIILLPKSINFSHLVGARRIGVSITNHICALSKKQQKKTNGQASVCSIQSSALACGHFHLWSLALLSELTNDLISGFALHIEEFCPAASVAISTSGNIIWNTPKVCISLFCKYFLLW